MSVRVKVTDLTVAYRKINSASRSLKTELLRSNKKIKRRADLQKIVLVDFSMEASSNKIVGVIGRNGAGKSSLIKAIAGVIRPTKGRVVVSGRVGALIELGGGFHPDLTARENIRIHFVLHGFSQTDAKLKETEIMEWADLEEVIDEPISTYSSGMLARFAFSVYTSIIPDVLILDEIMGVGDASFVEKSKKRMDRLIQSGAAVIIVSHDLNFLLERADEVIWIEDGRLKSKGHPAKVVAEYLEFMKHK